ncbi:2,3-bisphosphoglycerate-independent phosphoglycerate mutase-domain-containing protein [Dunaliella salina]|uniref:2,3-bisphosphoglycerate-independent phosphoglycerate mutase-domain-containing protein n=1 Tax=Dunaliella salina TaxID=3046 RepID=A0ABQ7H076_DUNSA|nr:2,3-bisphosphoglycerate-independent phosphoglycerate mutase-domain-containing protein [Dunaliella salina]|eukprot:KAF5840262.1 2,3-bisphosphoglycerate-independent phosphoglycerate mutase-domain-containing protein [Dunaliella salina]
MEKILFLLVDGIGDCTIPAFGDRTPLEVAHVPFLDAIAAAGLNGLMDPVEPGLACGSDTAHMSILGYDPRLHYRGRGAFESMGAGIAMVPGDIAFKCNFATLNTRTGIVEIRRADRNFEHLGPKFCADLDGTDPLKDNLPLIKVEALGSCSEEERPAAEFTARLVNELSQEIHQRLVEHPLNQERRAQGLNEANIILLRGCGCRIRVPGFQAMHGLRGVLVAPTKIIAGLGMSFDIDQIEAPGTTGYYNSAFHNKSSTICDALTWELKGQATDVASCADVASHTGQPKRSSDQNTRENQAEQEDGAGSRSNGTAAASCSGGQTDSRKNYDFGFVHVKAVDDTGHDLRLTMKVRFLEVVDKMLGQMVRRLWEAEQRELQAAQEGHLGREPQRFTIVVTGDHSTPVMFGDHSHEPVPFAVAHVRHVWGSAQLDLSLLVACKVKKLQPPPASEILRQAIWQDARRKADTHTHTWIPALADTLPAEVFGPYKQPWPQAVLGDPVRAFDELSAARGALGRFPGSQAMTVLKQMAGRS